MKKIYEIPVTTIVNIELQNIMQQTSINLGKSYSGGTIESRCGRNDWDDEEEDY